MKLQHPIIYIISLILLTGCAGSLKQPDNDVDRISLLRSMTYSHRNLVEIELEPKSIEYASRKSLLLDIHCDLIERRIVHAKKIPTVCKKTDDPKALMCIARFHRCIGECPAFKQYCPRCEKTMQRCKNP